MYAEEPAKKLGVTEEGWVRVLFAFDCDPCKCCREPWCSSCETHYCDCSCPGPDMQGYDYLEIAGHLCARIPEESS